MDEAAEKLLENQNLTVVVEGESYEILPEEVELRASAKAGLAVASEGAYLAALVTDLTPALMQEGLAREFVRRVQDLRKQADLDIADRIRIVYRATPQLAEALQVFSDYIQGETLATEMKSGTVPESMANASADFGDEQVTVGLEKA